MSDLVRNPEVGFSRDTRLKCQCLLESEQVFKTKINEIDGTLKVITTFEISAKTAKNAMTTKLNGTLWNIIDIFTSDFNKTVLDDKLY